MSTDEQRRCGVCNTPFREGIDTSEFDVLLDEYRASLASTTALSTLAAETSKKALELNMATATAQMHTAMLHKKVKAKKHELLNPPK